MHVAGKACSMRTGGMGMKRSGFIALTCPTSLSAEVSYIGKCITLEWNLSNQDTSCVDRRKCPD